MKPRKILLTLLATAFVTLMATSCKKYEDGPSFSLSSRTARMEGSWKVESATSVSGGVETDITAEVQADLTTLELSKDGDVKIYFGTDYDECKWEFGDKDETLIFVYDIDDREEWEIRRLKKKELWIRLVDTDGSYVELHFKQ